VDVVFELERVAPEFFLDHDLSVTCGLHEAIKKQLCFLPWCIIG
jgi:hypothetical protein